MQEDDVELDDGMDGIPDEDREYSEMVEQINDQEERDLQRAIEGGRSDD